MERIDAWPRSSFTTSMPAPRAKSSVAVAWRNMCGVTARARPGPARQPGQPLPDAARGHRLAERRVSEVDEHEVARLGLRAGLPLGEVVVVAGEDLARHRHGSRAGLRRGPVGVGACDDVQVRAGDRAAEPDRGLAQV